MKIIRNLTLLAMLLLPLGARADVVNVSSPGNFAVKTLHSNSAVVYCYSLTNGNTYILQNDVSMDAHIHIPSEATVTIDLNNHKLSRGLASPYGWGFVIYNDGGNLTITDSSNEKGGIITGGYNNGDGSGIYNNSGTLTIEGGTFSGNHAASNGGAIYIKTGTLNLKGGTITNNIANNQGAGIYVESDGTMNMQGAPIITGNRVGGSYNNLFLSNNVVINIDAGGLTGSVGSIGVTKDSPGLITTALDNATRYQIFVSDKNNCETTNVVDNTENKAYYQTCWMGLANQMNAGGSISLDAAKVYEAYSTDPCLTVPSGKTVDLDLNGLTLNRSKSSAEADGCAIKVESGGTLTISGSGTIKGGKNSSGGGGIQNLGTLTISGGTIRENTSTSWGGGIHNEGILNISGGIIEQNTASGCNGGGIHNTGTLNITGGTIRNNSATGSGLGAGIYHDGATFNLEGEPYISGNASKNVYLTAAHHTITITGNLTNTTKISLNMESLGVFTSGLNGYTGTYDNFTSEAGNAVALVDNTGEAELITYWNYLNRQIKTDGSYTLELGKVYEAGSSDSYLHVESGKTVTINMNGVDLNRNLSSATNDGCVIFNEGNLTISGSGTIKGGNNSDATLVKGGGICNTGTLTLAGGTISNNTTAVSGGGVYHNGTAFNLQDSPSIRNNSANGVADNAYLASGKIINITGVLNYSNSYPIGISTAEDRKVFTSGLNNNGDANKFTANQTGKGIGLNGDGEAIIGPSYNISRSEDYTGTSATLYIKNVTSGTHTAVEGEVVKVKVTTDGIPISLSYSPGASLSPYPKSNVEYSFEMPASDVTVESVCRWGGYCGAASEEDIKYYIDENQVLKFITKDDNDYSMASYGAGSAPWVNQTYASVEIPKRLTVISDYAFCDKNQHLVSFIVDAANPSFKADGGLLFNNDKTQLIFYPSGKTDAETYTVPAAVTAIQDGAFAFNTTLKTISVAGGSSFTAGADGVLYNGNVLICYPAGKTEESYTVVASVTEIKPYAFQSCTALRNLYVLRSTEEGGITAGGVCMLDGTDSSLKIIVKKTSVDAYKGDPNWSAYSDKIVAMDLSNSITITLNSSNPDDFDYTGSAITPTITVRDIVGTELTPGNDYTVAYSDNIAVGTGHITVTGQGNYAGEKTIDFYITRKVIFNSTKDYATYYSNEDLEIMSGGKAYIITEVNWTTGDITKAEVNYIKAQTPVILYKSGIGNAGNNPYHLKAHAGSAYPDLYGYFMGKDNATSYNALKTDGISDIYVLRGSSFVKVVSASENLPANRCYLARPSASGSRGIDSLSLEGGDNDATSLIEVKDEEMNNNEWYTLDGRKLQGKPTKKGVYVSKGKKIVVH